MDNKNKEINVTDFEQVKELFGLTGKSESLEDEVRILGDTMNVFFKIEDDLGLSKTDISSKMVFPFSMVLDYAQNPLPLYNKYLEKKLSEDDYKKQKVTIPIIENFLVEIYIKSLISKDRKGRKEGEEIGKSILDIARSKFGMSNMFGNKDNTQKYINDMVK